MISINTTDTPLDFDLSLNDFLRQLMPHHQQRGDRLAYSYQSILTINKAVGIILLPETLIYYPELARQIRKLKQLTYEMNLNLKKIDCVFQKGLASIVNSLNLIQTMLHEERYEKAKLDAQVNNLICLYGQEKTSPILKTIKPYFYNRTNTYPHSPTTRYIINITGINYYLHYHGNRFGTLKRLFSITPYQLLNHYFETTKRDTNAISRSAITDFIGGVINTPIFAFRVRQSSHHRGKKYFINLANYQTYTRLAEIKEAARPYTSSFNLKLIKD